MLFASLLLAAAPAADFQLADAGGVVHRLSEPAAPATAVVFLGVDCPLARLYGPRLGELHREFAPRGVRFLAVNANAQDGPADLTRYAREFGLPFPYLKDPGGAVAAAFGAERTPEAFVLDAGRQVRYRGRIDDQYTPGLQRAAVGRRDLGEALAEVLAGKPVSVPHTAAVGCRISRPKEAGGGPVTYCRDVAPVVQRHCRHCHRPGQIGPFALVTYRDAKNWSETALEVIENGRMPPWHADPAHGRFANDPRLTAAEKATFRRWVEAGCPEGDPADLPPPPDYPDGWSIPGPDRVFAPREPFRVPAEGVVEYQYFEVDPGLREDAWVTAAEVRPGNRKVVHHCNVFLRPPALAGTDFAETGRLGSFCLTAFAVGTPPLALPPGMAKRVPAGWRLLFVVHYTTVGTPQEDRTELGLNFAPEWAVRKEVATKLLYDEELNIPPGAARHRVEKTLTLDRDLLVLALFPHMHLRGRSFRYEAVPPGGPAEVLLDVPAYDFNWQHRYVPAEPKRLPAGTVVRCTAVYDNSADNPANPDPTATVRTGKQSWDEMFNGYLEVAEADQDLVAERHRRRWLWGACLALAGVLVVARLRRG